MRFLPLAFLLAVASAPVIAQDKPPAPEPLPTAIVLAVQDALIWTGDFDGIADGKPGPAFAAAVKQFQTREAKPVTGTPTPGDMWRLSQIVDEAKKSADWRLEIDGPNDVVLGLPRGLLPDASRNAEGRHFQSSDGTAQLQIFKAKGDLASVHAAAKGKAGRTVNRAELKGGRSLVAGTDGQSGFVDFATGPKGKVKGFRLTYPVGQIGRFVPAAIAISNNFYADPTARPSEKAPRAAPSFDGAFNAPEKGRLYPFATVTAQEPQAQITLGPVSARLTARKVEDPDMADFFDPILEIQVEGQAVLTVEDKDRQTQDAGVRAVELDPTNGLPEVLLTTFTGGAHCCTTLTIFTVRTDGSWARVDAGDYDGAPDFPQDVDGDGRYEIVAPDNAFYYAFDCYACSYAPDKIERLDGDTLNDVSARPEFRKVFAQWLPPTWAYAWAEGAVSGNGFLPALVAASRRIGESEDAWTFLKAHYDKNNDTGIEGCSVPLGDNGCPPDKIVKRTYPEAVETFLREQGY
jgi:peptidoglycan hydrolase-like protein with peptidoglycan-binding domain